MVTETDRCRTPMANFGVEKVASIHFVCPPIESFFLRELVNPEKLTDPAIFRKAKIGQLVWSIQTYLQIHDRFPDVTIGYLPKRGAINFAHASTWRKLAIDWKSIVVSIDADRKPLSFADFHIVQNKDKLDNKKSFWVPHWPQPRIIPRDPSRGDQVQTVGFFGLTHNLFDDWDGFKREIYKYGIRAVIKEPEEWHNYSDIDIVVGIRDFRGWRHSQKPPTKLINSAFAGSAFLGGMDSAYEQIGMPGRDYWQIRTRDELVAAIIRLANNPKERKKMVTNASAHVAANYGFSEIINYWEEAIQCIKERSKQRGHLSSHLRPFLYHGIEKARLLTGR